MQNILIFYSEYMPYTHVVVLELVKLKYCVHVVRRTEGNETPYVAKETKGICFYSRSEYNSVDKLLQLYHEVEPVLILTSGWMDALYNKTCKQLKSNTEVPIIAGSDTQFRGKSQWINVLLSPFRHRKWFTHLFVAGIWQYGYARRLGFKKESILISNLSADVELFQQVDIAAKEKNYPKNLLFIGRYNSVKGLIPLMKAWDSIEDKQGWKLTLVGNGPLKKKLSRYDVELLDFRRQEELMEITQNAGCLILPSSFEPWALVLHEASAAGLPIIASDICGAVPYFVINGYNGYTFSHKRKDDLKKKIEKVINMKEQELVEWSLNSRKLSSRITPEIVAKTLVSIRY